MITDGTALDASLLLDYIASYIFPTPSSYRISENIACGVSLGGHVAWQCLVHEPRFTTVISIIGCPDYLALMTDRARLTKLASYQQSSPQGGGLLGSKDFPQSLVTAVEKHDPASMTLVVGPLDSKARDFFAREPSQDEKCRLKPLMYEALNGKRMLNMSGGKDKLVPYKCSQAYVQWLENSVAASGWLSDCGFLMENIIFEEVGHAMSADMAKTSERFIVETLSGSPSGVNSGAEKAFKM